VLELGEEVLARTPQDAGTQMEMADSADQLGLRALAVWMLEQAMHQDPKHLGVQRALAGLLEKQGRYREAIAVWAHVRKADPTDVEAARKIKDLAASETIARGHYEA
jgi:cytochrome c-type biogenesis protein CcmH/NrfG